MSDYFDRVEQGLREAVRRGAHIPWYERLRLRPSRPVTVVLACLVVTGSALAATGAFRTGAPIGAEVPAIPTANEGAVIPASIALLPLRVADPAGGPPWGLRTLKTTRGLMCVQVGRIVDGRIGVLGRYGAFGNDGAFHPFSPTFMEGPGCGTEDARGDAFARVAVTNFDSHFEINTTNPISHDKARCPISGGGMFGPTNTNLRAGQRVRYVTFFNPRCPGISHITVGLVTVNGPSGSMPVPGLPGQSPEIPVGRTSIMLP